MENNTPKPESIEVPSLDTIQELPTVELPTLDDAQPAPQVQPIPQAQPAQPTVPQAPSYYAASMPQSYPYAAPQTVVQEKRTGGRIAALVIGIILTILFGGMFLLFLLVDAATGFEEIETSIIVHIFFGILTLPGIFLIIFGAKKQKIVTVVQPYAAPAQQPYAAPVQQSYAAPTQQPYAAPTQQPYAAPTQQSYAAPTQQPYAAPTQQSYAAPVQQSYTAPVQNAAPVQTPMPQQTTAPTAVDPNVGSTSGSFDYAPVSALATEDLATTAKKSARKAAIISLAIVAVMWVIFLALVVFFKRWVMSWYLLVIPIIAAVGAIKSCPKSVLAWISLIVSILSIVMFILVSIQLQPQF